MREYNDLGSFLKYIRKIKGLSLRKLANKIEIAHSTISDIERGITRIQKTHIEKILELLDLDEHEIKDFLFYATLNRSDIYDSAIKYLVEKRMIHDFIYNLSKSGFTETEISKITKSFYEILSENGVGCYE